MKNPPGKFVEFFLLVFVWVLPCDLEETKSPRRVFAGTAMAEVRAEAKRYAPIPSSNEPAAIGHVR